MKILFCTEEVENPFILAHLCRLARESLNQYESSVYVVSPHEALPKEYADLNHIRIPQTDTPKNYKDWDTYLYLRHFKDSSAKQIRSKLQSIDMLLGDMLDASITVDAAPMLSLLAYVKGYQINQVTTAIHAIPESKLFRELISCPEKHPRLGDELLKKINFVLTSFKCDHVKNVYEIFGNMPTYIRGIKALDFYSHRGGVPNVRYIAPSRGIRKNREKTGKLKVMLIDLPQELESKIREWIRPHMDDIELTLIDSIHDPEIYKKLPSLDILISDVLHPIQIDALYYNVMTFNFVGKNGKLAECESYALSASLFRLNASARASVKSDVLHFCLKHRGELTRYLENKLHFQESVLYYPKPDYCS